MSQLNNVVREFLIMKNKYDWDRMETVLNLHYVLRACKWELFSEDELKEKGIKGNRFAICMAERDEIHRLLFNSIVEPNTQRRPQ
jgi:hypothetical protein